MAYYYAYIYLPQLAVYLACSRPLLIHFRRAARSLGYAGCPSFSSCISCLEDPRISRYIGIRERILSAFQRCFRFCPKRSRAIIYMTRDVLAGPCKDSLKPFSETSHEFSASRDVFLNAVKIDILVCKEPACSSPGVVTARPFAAAPSEVPTASCLKASQQSWQQPGPACCSPSKRTPQQLAQSQCRPLALVIRQPINNLLQRWL